MAAASEAEIIAILGRFNRVRRDDVVQGIGDDAARVRPWQGMELALATDTLVKGVHFPEGTAPADVGWKSLAVNLSDLAATGAVPAWSLLALTLPEGDAEWVTGFAAGFAELAGEHEVALVGGDTTRGPLSVTVQVAGYVEPGRAMTRAGARPGDAVYVTGTLGDAAAGLAVVQGRLPGGSGSEPLRARLLRPRPRVEAGRRLGRLASACIDLSDGLVTDLEHLLVAGDCGAVVELDRLPASRALQSLVPDDVDRRRLQIAGDDYELCFTAPVAHDADIRALADELDLAITRVGEIRAGGGMAFTDGGRPADPPGRGWRHFGNGDA